MASIQSSDELKIAIIELEERLAVQRKQVIMSIHSTYKSLNPISLIKSTIHRATELSDKKDNSLNTIIGLGTGLLLKKIIPKRPGGYVKNILAALIELALTNKVSKDREAIDTLSHEILNGSEET